MIEKSFSTNLNRAKISDIKKDPTEKHCLLILWNKNRYDPQMNNE